tara:strand:- start:6378 stop:6878 length:501 start_codon:yes stop_codon:yes gene_type:complete
MPKLSFQPGIEEESNEWSQLPKGWYKGHLMESYFQDFKNGNGVALVLDFTVDNNGIPRRIRSYNTWRHNTSEDAVKWGQLAVKQFFRACDKAGAESTEECHNVPIEILIHEGEKYNVVKGFRKLSQGPPPTGKVMRPSYPIPSEAVVDKDKVATHAAKYDDDDIPF